MGAVFFPKSNIPEIGKGRNKQTERIPSHSVFVVYVSLFPSILFFLIIFFLFVIGEACPQIRRNMYSEYIHRRPYTVQTPAERVPTASFRSSFATRTHLKIAGLISLY